MKTTLTTIALAFTMMSNAQTFDSTRVDSVTTIKTDFRNHLLAETHRERDAFRLLLGAALFAIPVSFWQGVRFEERRYRTEGR